MNSLDLTKQKSSIFIKQLSKSQVENLLDEIDDYNKNPYYSRENFQKSFYNECEYYGLFNEEKCLALLAITKNIPDKNFACMHNLASFFPGKGYGINLLKQVLKKFKDIWWMANPDGGEKLADNYRKISGIKEYTVEKSSYKGLPIHFFYKINDEKKISELKDFLDKTWKRKS
jgi:hypothetical protein